MTSGPDAGITCMHCGYEQLDEGFIEDNGAPAQGDARWIAGPLERGRFGGAKRKRRTRRQIIAFRCPRCGHLELFARDEA